MATTSSTMQPMVLAPALNLQPQPQPLKKTNGVGPHSPITPLWLHAGLAPSSPLIHDFAPFPHAFCTNKARSASSGAQFQTIPQPFTSALPLAPEANSGSDFEMIGQEYCPEQYSASWAGFQTSSFMVVEPFLDQQSSPAMLEASMAFLDKLSLSTADVSPDVSQNTIGPINISATKCERRKAQNRRAQRAFRVRQQKVLNDATTKMQSLQEELKNAVTAKENFQRLFTELSSEHERLRAKLEEILVSPRPSHLLSPHEDSLSDTESE